MKIDYKIEQADRPINNLTYIKLLGKGGHHVSSTLGKDAIITPGSTSFKRSQFKTTVPHSSGLNIPTHRASLSIPLGYQQARY